MREHNCFLLSFPTITSTSSHYQAMRQEPLHKSLDGVARKMLCYDRNEKKKIIMLTLKLWQHIKLKFTLDVQL